MKVLKFQSRERELQKYDSPEGDFIYKVNKIDY